MKRKEIIDALVKKGFYRPGCLLCADSVLLALAVREGIVKREPQRMANREIYLANSVLFD